MNLNFQAFMARLRAAEGAPPWPPSTGLWLLLAFIAARVVVAPLLVTAVLSPEAVTAGISPAITNLSASVGDILALSLAWVTLRRAVRGPMIRALRLDRTADSAWLVALFSLGAAIVVDFAPLAFQTIGLPVNLIGLAGGSAPTWLLAAFFTVIIGPLTDAVLLHGVLYPALAARAGNLRAILLTALAFMVAQVIDNPADRVLWLESLLAGLYLTGVRAHQQSSRAAVLAGMMFGVFAMFKAMRLFL